MKLFFSNYLRCCKKMDESEGIKLKFIGKVKRYVRRLPHQRKFDNIGLRDFQNLFEN